MAVQEIADAMERLASQVIEVAAATPSDEEAIERALATAEAASRASEEEFEASAQWGYHLERIEALVHAVDELARRL